MIEKAKLSRLKACLDRQASIKGSIDTIKTNLATQLLEPMKTYNGLGDEIKLLKADLTKEALEEFKETESKTLTGGLKIKAKNSISYNFDEAYKFAKGKDLFLTLDVKAFEKAAPSLNLDFVKKHSDNQVTFPKEIKLED